MIITRPFLQICILILSSSIYASAQVDRIAIRQVNDQAEFYHKQTGATFYPRGFNYIQLVQSPLGPFGESELFQPDSHDPIAIDDDFQRMAALGYNAVRVFVDLCRDERCIADKNGLVPSYIENIAGLLRQAKTYGIYVMLTANWLPDAGDYSGPAHEICHSSGDFEGGNCLIMSRKGVELYQKFFTDFINALKTAGAPFDAIWAYQLRNEFFVEFNLPPFTKNSGSVITANGQTYDLSSDFEKEQMAQDAVVYWANSTREAILSVDPEALVCSGFFTPNDPNILRENDPRIVPFKAALDRSELDFFDIHAYAGFHDFQLEAENYRIIDYTEKPIVLGEYGTFLPNAATEYLAAQLSDHWMSAACSYGVQGFLYWTWDRHRTLANNADDPWAGSDSSAFIAKVLSPQSKIDPCLTTLPNTNVALGKPTHASMEWETFTSDQVVDGNATQTPWIAGGEPPQWVEVDLQDQYDLASIQIVVETGSDDPFFYTHEIQVKSNAASQYQTTHTFADDRVNFEILTFQPEDESVLKAVRFIRVLIPQAPGWAALHELSAFIPEQRSEYDVPPPPILTFPRPSLDVFNGSILRWKNNVGGLPADLQIATDSLFSSLIEESSGITNDQYDISHLLDNRILWWRVRQQNEIGTSAWSVTGKLDLMPTSVEQFSDVFNIYPNPFNHHLNIEFNRSPFRISHITLWDVAGKKIELADLSTPSLDLSFLEPGIYWLQLKTNDAFHHAKVLKVD